MMILSMDEEIASPTIGHTIARGRVIVIEYLGIDQNDFDRDACFKIIDYHLLRFLLMERPSPLQG